VEDDGSKPEEPTPEPPEPARARPRPRRLLLRFLILAAGLLVLMYFTQRAPRDQHVRLVLGDVAADVTAVDLQYVAADGEVMREARMTFDPGKAPRVVAHDPKLPDADYRLRIEVDTREGRRSVERRVTLGGGTTQVDLAGALAAPLSPTRTPQ
jgi:hypothetical protein